MGFMYSSSLYNFMKTNRSLRAWFMLHFIVDYVVAVPLFLFPFETLTFLGWQVIDPISARVVSAAFFAVGGISYASRNADEKTYYHLLILKIVWSISATAALVIAVLQGGASWGVWAAMILFILFGSVWIYFWLKLRYFSGIRINL